MSAKAARKHVWRDHLAALEAPWMRAGGALEDELPGYRARLFRRWRLPRCEPVEPDEAHTLTTREYVRRRRAAARRRRALWCTHQRWQRFDESL